MVALNSRVFFDVVKERGEFLLLGHEINNNLQQKVKTRLSLLTAKSEIKNFDAISLKPHCDKRVNSKIQLFKY